jgi:hypothetical protein
MRPTIAQRLAAMADELQREVDKERDEALALDRVARPVSVLDEVPEPFRSLRCTLEIDGQRVEALCLERRIVPIGYREENWHRVTYVVEANIQVKGKE